VDWGILAGIAIGAVVGWSLHSGTATPVSVVEAAPLSAFPPKDFKELSYRQRAELRAVFQELSQCHERMRDLRMELHREHTGYAPESGITDPPCTAVERSLLDFSLRLQRVVEGVKLSEDVDRAIASETAPIARLEERSVHPEVEFEPAAGLYRLTVDAATSNGTPFRKTIVGVDLDAMALRVLAELDRVGRDVGKPA